MCESILHWPLVIDIHRQAMTLERYRAQLDQWNHWLSRGERFAVLRIFTTPESLQHPPDAAPLAKQWMQEAVPLLQRWCLGVATVVAPQDFERLRRMRMEKALGVPGELFKHAGDAVHWVETALFLPVGISKDLPPIEALFPSEPG